MTISQRYKVFLMRNYFDGERNIYPSETLVSEFGDRRAELFWNGFACAEFLQKQILQTRLLRNRIRHRTPAKVMMAARLAQRRSLFPQVALLRWKGLSLGTMFWTGTCKRAVRSRAVADAPPTLTDHSPSTLFRMLFGGFASPRCTISWFGHEELLLLPMGFEMPPFRILSLTVSGRKLGTIWA